MNYTAQITIMPLKELLDPQGKAVNESLHRLGISAIDQVRIGKHITLQIEASDEKQAHTLADEACRKVLCNQVMESYSISINAQ
ncbi:MAG: phosphoribosylformylglycinamidine synthase subunit PurS [Bacteroidetes bacterium]|nr:phosphoribosylformylglycinamidine synthase subunit PurS [Bacteroidota bacterium]